MDEKIERYILDIVFATRQPQDYGLSNLMPLINYGGSPRASINLAKGAKAYAFLQRRGYVIPEDVRAVCEDIMCHRIGITYEAEAEKCNAGGYYQSGFEYGGGALNGARLTAHDSRGCAKKFEE